MGDRLFTCREAMKYLGCPARDLVLNRSVLVPRVAGGLPSEADYSPYSADAVREFALNSLYLESELLAFKTSLEHSVSAKEAAKLISRGYQKVLRMLSPRQHGHAGNTLRSVFYCGSHKISCQSIEEYLAWRKLGLLVAKDPKYISYADAARKLDVPLKILMYLGGTIYYYSDGNTRYMHRGYLVSLQEAFKEVERPEKNTSGGFKRHRSSDTLYFWRTAYDIEPTPEEEAIRLWTPKAAKRFPSLPCADTEPVCLESTTLAAVMGRFAWSSGCQSPHIRITDSALAGKVLSKALALYLGELEGKDDDALNKISAATLICDVLHIADRIEPATWRIDLFSCAWCGTPTHDDDLTEVDGAIICPICCQKAKEETL